MMQVYYFSESDQGKGAYARMVSDLLETKPIHTGEWQAMKTEGSPAHATHELEDVSLVWERVPTDRVQDMVPYVDTDWATAHFQERVSGQPLNPAPSHLDWPYAVNGNRQHTDETSKFDHTYPERFWPKNAQGGQIKWTDPVTDVPVLIEGGQQMKGVRFPYGDLSSVVDLLVDNPLTRQAYLPVWFPEDTGAEYGQRVPCTLGYHFMQRGGRLSVRYYLRSCDIYRHFSNDVFFAAALLNWVCNRVTEKTQQNQVPVRFRPGSLIMHVSSLHGFVGDKGKIARRVAEL